MSRAVTSSRSTDRQMLDLKDAVVKKLEILKSQLKEHITFFDEESQKHKRLYRRIRYSIFVLTALSTVLAGLAVVLDLGPWLNVAVVVTTASIGVLASIEGLRKPAELWLNERSIYHALEDLRREVDFHSVETLSAETIDAYFSRTQALLNAGSVKWQQHILQARDVIDVQQSVPANVAAPHG